MRSDKEIMENLQQSIAGLLMMSESDYPFEVIGAEGSQDLSSEYLRKLASRDSGDAITIVDINNFFRNSVSEAEWKNEDQIATARRFQNVVSILSEELSDIRVYKIGRIDIAVLIIGKTPQGNWLGLSTRVIET